MSSDRHYQRSIGEEMVAAIRKWAIEQGITIADAARLLSLPPNRVYGLRTVGRGLIDPRRMMFIAGRMGIDPTDWYVKRRIVPPDIADYLLDPTRGPERIRALYESVIPLELQGLPDGEWDRYIDEAEKLSGVGHGRRTRGAGGVSGP
jgi:hypothetical protein